MGLFSEFFDIYFCDIRSETWSFFEISAIESIVEILKKYL